MKRFVSFILAAALFLVPSLAYGATAEAFSRLFLTDKYYNHLSWSEELQWSPDSHVGQLRETAVSGGNQYLMYIDFAQRNGLREITAVGLIGPLEQFMVDTYPSEGYGSGFKMREGAEVYTAFFNTIYDIGLMPDNENCGTFFEASIFAPYDIYHILMNGDGIDYDYDHDTWKYYTHGLGYIEAVHQNGIRIIITGQYGGNFGVYVVLP